jgi:hypothetical protein
MQTENQTESKSHNRKHHASYTAQRRDSTKGKKKTLCRCPMCPEGKNLHRICMDWQGKEGTIPLKFCAKHQGYDEVMNGNNEEYRVITR